MVLGVLEDNAYSQAEMRLQSGDRLVLFTDGITEAEATRDASSATTGWSTWWSRIGTDRQPDILDAIFRDVSAFTAGVFSDDATLISVAVELSAAAEHPRPTSEHGAPEAAQRNAHQPQRNKTLTSSRQLAYALSVHYH